MNVVALCINIGSNTFHQLEQAMLKLNETVDLYCTTIDESYDHIQKLNPDVMFLGDNQGVNVYVGFLEYLNENKRKNYSLVAVSNNLELIQYLVNNGADKVLGTPVENGQVSRNLTNIMTNINKSKRVLNRLFLKTQETIEVVYVPEIKYIKAESNYTRVHLNSGEELLVSKNMRYLENLLEQASQFKRPHNSYLVNMNYVKRLIKSDNGELELKCQIRIPISRMKKREIHSFFNYGFTKNT